MSSQNEANILETKIVDLNVTIQHAPQQQINTAIKELVANAFDANDSASLPQFDVASDRQSTLVIKNNNKYLKPEHFTVGPAAPPAQDSGRHGFFGLGLKDAIAVLIRNRVTIEIWANQYRYLFIQQQGSLNQQTIHLQIDECDKILCNGTCIYLQFTGAFPQSIQAEVKSHFLKFCSPLPQSIYSDQNIEVYLPPKGETATFVYLAGRRVSVPQCPQFCFFYNIIKRESLEVDRDHNLTAKGWKALKKLITDVHTENLVKLRGYVHNGRVEGNTRELHFTPIATALGVPSNVPNNARPRVFAVPTLQPVQPVPAPVMLPQPVLGQVNLMELCKILAEDRNEDYEDSPKKKMPVTSSSVPKSGTNHEDRVNKVIEKSKFGKTEEQNAAQQLVLKIFKDQKKIKVNDLKLVGSLAKGLDIGESSDLDFILPIIGFPETNFGKWIPFVLATIEQILLETRDNRIDSIKRTTFSIQFKINGIDVDVLPRPNSLVILELPSIIGKLKEAEMADYPYFSAIFAPFQTQFIQDEKNKNPHLTGVIRLLKLWRDRVIWPKNSIPTKVCMEMIALKASKLVDIKGNPSPKMELLKMFFKLCAESTLDISDIGPSATDKELFFPTEPTQKQLKSRFDNLTLAGFGKSTSSKRKTFTFEDSAYLVLDPVNPSNNLAAGFSCHQLQSYSKDILESNLDSFVAFLEEL